MSNHSALITGASGFIGSHLAARLLARGSRVHCLVRSTSRFEALRASGAQPIVGDVLDRATVCQALQASQAQVVFHLAGLVRALCADDFKRVNAVGVDNVAAACAEQPMKPVLVIVSSLAAAGPSGDLPKIESDRPAPVSDYGRSKLAGEHAATRYAAVVPTTIVRPGVVFGAGDRGVYEVFKPIAGSGIHVVPAGIDQRVALIALADVVDCILLAAQAGERLAQSEPGRGIYFAAAGDLTHIELGRAIAHALGREPPRIIRLPHAILRAVGRGGDIVARIRGRAGWLGRDKVSELLAGSWTCSSSKARQHLGWSPAASLADRLQETARWYREAGWL